MGLSAEAPAPSATAFDEDEGPDRLAGTPLAAPRRVGLSRATHAVLLLAVAATLSALSLARGRAAARLVEEIAAGRHAGLRLRRRGESWGVVAEDGAGPFRAAERDLGAVPRRHRRRRWALALFAMQLGLFIAVLELGA